MVGAVGLGWPGLLLLLSPAVPGLLCVLRLLGLLGSGAEGTGPLLAGLVPGLVVAGPTVGPPRGVRAASPGALGP